MTQTMTGDAGVLETLREVVDQASAGRVFGEPITTADGMIVLPVARVGGGGGGGGGTAPAEDGKENGGAGGGFTVSAKPLGVFVIRDRGVSWRPAVDVNKIILGGQLVAVTALLVARAVLTARAARRRRPSW
ncbi:spore germination protein GerW family protein [Krasilnikovia sp. M28-CT-15]|uniref:spore germination protein GerW family protein n=1 Tax=Krasilnikovia sp. M28-CT-15 TaxID=3373540 RepID=UPI003875FCCE